MCRRKKAMKRRLVYIFIICSMILCGCSCNYLEFHNKAGWSTEVSPDVISAWREHQSYYACIEILDTYIHPWEHIATKADVLKYLGPGENDPEEGHPNSGPNLWIYPSNRKVPFGSYCMIFFDKNGKVSDIGWCDE
jgi:hypothetical protein